MNWARVSSIAVGVAVAMILVAYAPPIVTEPIYTAVAQVRANASASALLLKSIEQAELNKSEFQGATGSEVAGPTKK